MTRPRGALVLDSCACLALLEGELRGAAVADLLREAEAAGAAVLVSTVNLTEVCYILWRRAGEGRVGQALQVLSALPVQFVPPGVPVCTAAARLKATYSLGLGDCFAAALALASDAALVTADPHFHRLEPELTVIWLPPGGGLGVSDTSLSQP